MTNIFSIFVPNKLVMTIIQFYQKFGTNELCFEHLSNLKWGSGFICSKCKCTDYRKGNSFFDRRCKKCNYNESATANTIFHGVKFPLVKAFLICYRMSTKKGMSTHEIAKEIGITQKTAWIFCAKMRTSMESSGLHLLEGEVHVDECVIGGKESKKPGRSLGKKKPVLMMIEIRENNTIGRLYAQKIKDYTKKTIYPILKKTINIDAKIVSDEYPTYDKVKETFKNAIQVKSMKGANYLAMHQQIMNLKSAIRGIHHKISDKHIQSYLDQYCYRTNRRIMKKPIVLNLIQKAVVAKVITYEDIKRFAA
jgi:ISXO2-like transposase domain/Transposase zinc-ribbon domain